MIRKLRNKLIMINMLLVSAVLLIVFIVITISNHNSFKTESINEMMKAIDDISSAPKLAATPKPAPDAALKPYATPKTTSKSPAKIPDNATKKHEPQKRSSIPVFTVLRDSKSGEILSTDMKNTTISDSDYQTAISTAFADSDGSGTISSISIRYTMRSQPTGNVYAFADITNEITTLTNQVLTMLFAGIGGLIAFFLISLLLSNIAIKPSAEAWNRQRQFVADASHELRTPLTVILANISILSSMKDKKDSSRNKWIDSTYTEAFRMKELIDDMLFLARSDSEQKQLFIKSEMDLSDAVWSCILPFESIAFEKGVTIASDIVSGLTAYANEAQIKHLVSALLDNACKYSNDNGVVYVKLKPEQDNHRIILSVNNTGNAIPQEDLPHIFERFYRADKSRTSNKSGGYGLGLSIAYRIVENHNGKITVQSNEKDGTTFTVILPVNPR